MANTFTILQYKGWVRERLDDASFADSLLLQFANDTNREVIGSTRWPFMLGRFTGTIAAGMAEYNQPADYQSAINFTVVSPDNRATELCFVPFEEFDEVYPDPTALTPSAPSIWTDLGNTFMVGPAAPDQTYTLQLRYWRGPSTTITADTSTVDVPDDWAELMILGMYRRALMFNDLFDQAQVVAQDFELLLAKMKTVVLRRQTGQNLVLRSSRFRKGTRGVR